MKKLIALLLALVMVLSLVACGGSTEEKTEAPAAEAPKAEAPAAEAPAAEAPAATSIRLVNGKIEIDAQLKKLAEMYKAETGVEVIIESMGGGVDIMGTLKGYYQADNMPEIFVTGSTFEVETWGDLLADMSAEAWTKDTDAAYVHPEYGTVGFPYTVEAIGLI